MTRSFVTLDGLRGVAALCIVVLHCNRFFGDFTWSSAALAVDLFFVLSGFVLAFAYGERVCEKMSRWQFVKARIIRLYPLYLVGTLLGLVEAYLVIRYQQGAIPWNWAKFLAALPFAMVMLPAPGQSTLFPFNGVMWSIFFELVINVVWAVFWQPLRSSKVLIGIVVLSGFGLATCVLATGSMWQGAGWNTFVGGFFRVSYSFFLGVLLYRIHQRGMSLPKIPPLALLAALPAVLFIPMPVPARLAVALFVLPWFVILGAQVEPRKALAAVCAKLGAASYAIYAVHKRIYLLAYAGILQLLNIDVQVYASEYVGTVFMAVLIAGCLFLDRFYDKPAREWLSRITRTKL